MKRFLIGSLVILFGIFLITGCAKQQIAQTPEQQGQAGAKAAETQKSASKDLSKEAITGQDLGKTQMAASQYSAKELISRLSDIHFDFDKYDVRDDAKPTLKELSGILSKNTKAKVVAEGHCDERGTVEYNLALGEKRASAVKSYLISLGIPSSRVDTVSYGKEKPLCSDSSETCWAKNRRAHFVLLEESR